MDTFENIEGAKERFKLDSRSLADRAFSRAAGAPLVQGNCVRLLKDAAENYARWLDAIAGAKRHIHFECYIIHEDKTGNMFADECGVSGKALLKFNSHDCGGTVRNQDSFGQLQQRNRIPGCQCRFGALPRNVFEP